LEPAYDIIIIGAGAAGLMAASVLTDAGKKILMLEGRDRIGGRIHSIHYGDRVLEAGAEFIHGNLPLTLSILKDSGTDFVQVKGKMYNSFRGELTRDEDWGSGWHHLMKKMRELKKDLPLQEFLDLHFPENKYASIRRTARGFAEGFDLANVSDASTMNLYKEWSNEQDSQYRIPDGYGMLIEWLARRMENGFSLLLNHQVKKVIWERGFIRIKTSDEKEFSCKKILITIPISLLQNQALEASIHFDPHITSQMILTSQTK
jgi:monoamine oxidase